MAEARVTVRRMTLIRHVFAAASLLAGPAQSPAGTKLSSEVREYVKFDDALLALVHVRVIDGTAKLLLFSACSSVETRA